MYCIMYYVVYVNTLIIIIHSVISNNIITGYSMYLGLKPQPEAQPGTVAFVCVCGPSSQCGVVSRGHLRASSCIRYSCVLFIM